MESFWKHLEALRASIFRMTIAVGAITVFVFLCDIRRGELGGITVYYPYPDIYQTISTRVFLQIKHDLLPSSVRLVSFTPWAAMVIQFQISILLGVILGMPVIIHQVGTFLRPALKRQEKRLILRLVLPATALFLLGNLFAYYLIIPFSIDFLYNFAFAMGIEQFFSVDEFFSFVMLFLVAFGVVFELPVVMVGLTSLGAVSADFWKEHWRWAVLLSLVFAAVITPDGTGVTMFLVAGPMLFLYLVGYLISKSANKTRSVGLILSAVGSAVVLFSGLQDAFGLMGGGTGLLAFAEPNWPAVWAGVATYLVGLLMVGSSMRQAAATKAPPK